MTLYDILGLWVKVVMDCYGLAGCCSGAGAGAGAGVEVGVGPPQMKFAYGTGRRFGGGGSLKQCDSSHRTRGSVPSGDTGRMNSRT